MEPLPSKEGLSPRDSVYNGGNTPQGVIMSITPNNTRWTYKGPPKLNTWTGFYLEVRFPYKYMKTKGKEMILKQRDVFLDWGERVGVIASDYENWLNLFIRSYNVTDVCDITNETVDQFGLQVYNAYNTRHAEKRAITAVKTFQRFYMARSKNGLKRPKGGRPPAIEKYEKAQSLRKAGLSFREIARVLEVDVSLAYRWTKKKLEQFV